MKIRIKVCAKVLVKQSKKLKKDLFTTHKCIGFNFAGFCLLQTNRIFTICAAIGHYIASTNAHNDVCVMFSVSEENR